MSNHQEDFLSTRNQRPPHKILLGQTLRKLLKATVWESLTTLPKLLGHPLQTIQVLVIDRNQEKVLLLRTGESKTGYTAVQGLRLFVHRMPLKFGYSPDPREDAQRELAEEAVATELCLTEFHLIHHYPEGSHGQFDCRVYVVEADSERLWLVDETTEGLPVWESFEKAGEVLNETLRNLLAEQASAGRGL